MSTVGLACFVVIAGILLAQSVVCWSAIKEAKVSDKVFFALSVGAGCASAFLGDAMEAQLWLLVGSYQVAEMRLKSRVRELGGAA